MPPRQATTAAPTSSHPGWQPPVWLPWVSAPLFFLLPIGGCGAAAVARRPAPPASAAAADPLPGPAPVATMVTVLTPRR
jgi:hypothetical protein